MLWEWVGPVMAQAASAAALFSKNKTEADQAMSGGNDVPISLTNNDKEIVNVLKDQVASAGSVDQMVRNLNSSTIIATVLVVVLAYIFGMLIKRGLRKYYGDRSNATGLIGILVRTSKFILMWLMANIVWAFLPYHQISINWFKFLSQFFGVLVLIRMFLIIVQRALPEGRMKRLIERVVILGVSVFFITTYIGKMDAITNWLKNQGVNLGSVNLNLLDLITFAITLFVVALLIRWINSELEDQLVKKPKALIREFDISSRVAMTRVIKGVLFVFAALFSLSAAGMDLRLLSIFGGALGVGMGLGLQRIASNYVSGFVMLFEKGVKIGDLITTNAGERGFVRQINARYTLLEGVSGDEMLIPNEHLLINVVTNWSHTNETIWLTTHIPVEYDTNVHMLIKRINKEIPKIRRVLYDPPASAMLSKITDRGLIIEVTWWINDPENGRLNITSDVNLCVHRIMKEMDTKVFSNKALSYLDANQTAIADQGSSSDMKNINKISGQERMR